MLENFGVRVMADKSKITINVDKDLRQTIEAIGVSKSHSSLTETVLYLLKKAIYIETENVTASYVQLFLKEELDVLSHKLTDEATFALEEMLSQQMEVVAHRLQRSNMLSLANLIVTSNAVAMTDEEADDFRADALHIAAEIEESE